MRPSPAVSRQSPLLTKERVRRRFSSFPAREGGRGVRPRWSQTLGLITVLLTLGLSWARADRILLAPQAETLAPNTVKWDFSLSPYRRNESYLWLQYASPVGIELELQRLELLGDFKKRYAFNIQYPLISDLGNTPAVSVGVRDLLSTGREHQALYLCVGKSLGLSDRQARVFQELKLEAGVGSGRMNGLFVGALARLRSGLQFQAEVFRQKPNVGLSLPLVRNLQVKISSLDGDVFYGLSYALTR